MVEITGINIAIGGRGEVDQGSIFLSFQVNIAHFGGLLQNILWRVVVVPLWCCRCLRRCRSFFLFFFLGFAISAGAAVTLLWLW